MIVAGIDAGTTGVRCMLVDSNGDVRGLGRRSWGYTTPPDLEIAKEFDTTAFWRLTCEAIREAIDSSKVSASDIKAVATTSQRHGAVFLDKERKTLYAGPNIDARGAMTQYVIEDEMGPAYQEITGCWPPLMFAPARLAWFEEEEPEKFSRVQHILTLSDWLTHELSAEFVTDLSAASGTGLLDIRKKTWSGEVADLVGVDTAILPDIIDAGSVVGHVTDAASRSTGFSAGLAVVQGGSDTSCALLAAQASQGEITVIAGSTTPVMLLVDAPICSAEQAVWTGCHMGGDTWVLESNATLTGAYLEWAVRILCERSEDPEACARRTYHDLSKIVEHVPPGSNDTYIALGPSIMDCWQITNIPQARMYFPQPALPQVIPLSAGSFIRGVIENIAFAVRGNIEQLAQYGVPTRIKTIGGMTQSGIWASILSNVMAQSVSSPLQPEGSLLGAAICASVGAESHASLEEGMREMVAWKDDSNPDECASHYRTHYEKWRKIWFRGDADA